MTQNKAFMVVAGHTGTDTLGYRFYLNGALVEEKHVSALVNNQITFGHTGLPRGTYTVEVSAYNADGEAKTPPVTVIMTGAAPSAPINVQIVVVG